MNTYHQPASDNGKTVDDARHRRFSQDAASAPPPVLRRLHLTFVAPAPGIHPQRPSAAR